MLPSNLQHIPRDREQAIEQAIAQIAQEYDEKLERGREMMTALLASEEDNRLLNQVGRRQADGDADGDTDEEAD